MRYAFCTAIAVICLPALAQERDFSGLVVGITDGDTLTVLKDDRDQVNVRLAEIDTPEDGQPYSNRSRQTLSELVFRQNVRVVYMDTDLFGRTVGRVYAGSGEIDVSAEMIGRGNAWVYREYKEGWCSV